MVERPRQENLSFGLGGDVRGRRMARSNGRQISCAAGGQRGKVSLLHRTGARYKGRLGELGLHAWRDGGVRAGMLHVNLDCALRAVPSLLFDDD